MIPCSSGNRSASQILILGRRRRPWRWTLLTLMVPATTAIAFQSSLLLVGPLRDREGQGAAPRRSCRTMAMLGGKSSPEIWRLALNLGLRGLRENRCGGGLGKGACELGELFSSAVGSGTSKAELQNSDQTRCMFLSV